MDIFFTYKNYFYKLNINSLNAYFLAIKSVIVILYHSFNNFYV